MHGLISPESTLPQTSRTAKMYNSDKPIPKWCIGIMDSLLVSSEWEDVPQTCDSASMTTNKLETMKEAVAHWDTWQSCIYGECGLLELHSLFCVLEDRLCLSFSQLRSSSSNKKKAGTTFVDLGHGNGSVVLSAMLLRGWGTVLGVELVPERFKRSELQLRRWEAMVLREEPPDARQRRLGTTIQLKCGDACDLSGKQVHSAGLFK
jgi:hypothetical protein